MTQDRFILHQHPHYGDGIEDTTKSDSQILIDSIPQCCDIMNELNNENIELKQNNLNGQNWAVKKLIIEYDTTNKYSEKDVIDKIKQIMGLVLIE